MLPNGAVGADFYAGKTIRVTVGFVPGGGYDTYARLVAQHMGKHIPGSPALVVDNMEGAGSLIATNYTYNKADRDGTFVGVWNSAYVLYQALGDRAVRSDAKKLNWIVGFFLAIWILALCRPLPSRRSSI
jgi:tripartite-type tricarboxylate transporter receptor subunit TctC